MLREGETQIWQGELHLGDTPGAFPKIPYVGLCVEIPFKTPAQDKFEAKVDAKLVEILAGPGHEVSVVGSVDGKEVILGHTRLKNTTGNEAVAAVPVDVSQLAKRPDHLRVRVVVDSTPPYSLWDDFILLSIGYKAP